MNKPRIYFVAKHDPRFPARWFLRGQLAAWYWINAIACIHGLGSKHREPMREEAKAVLLLSARMG